MKRLRVVVGSMAAGAAGAWLPLVASAQGADFDAASRAMEPTGDSAMIMFVTAGATALLFLLSAIGYLYRRERGLEWPFQRPDAPHSDH